MNYENFQNYMHRLYAAFNKQPAPAQMTEYWDSFRNTDDNVFAAAFTQMKDECERFPSISMMKQKITQSQRNLFGSGKSHWDEEKWKAVSGGAGCTCDMGLIFVFEKKKTEADQNYTYVFRCPVCRSYDAISIPEYRGHTTTPDEEKRYGS